jgi:putative transposase
MRAAQYMSSSEADSGGEYFAVSRRATGSCFDGAVTDPQSISRAYRMRVYPNKAQQRMLSRLVGATRFVWNWALARRTDAYRADGTKLNWIALSRELTQLRAAPVTDWLSTLPREPFNQVLRDQERAFTNFFAKRAAYPRFRRRGAPAGMRFTIDQRHVERTLERGAGEDRWARIQLPGLGEMKLRRTEELTGRLRSVTLRCEAGRWYASITADGIEAACAPAEHAFLGVDAGLKDLLVRSDAVRVSAPAALRQNQSRLRRYQRHYVRQRDAAARRQGLDRTKPFPKGTRIEASNRMWRTKRRVAKLHARIGAIRREAMHRATTDIVRTAHVIAIEDLAVKAISRSMGRKAFRRSAGNAALGELRRQIQYKARWSNRIVHLVDRFYPSSKTCSVCGAVNGTLALKERSWICSTCNTEHDRDINAAINLEAHARRALESSPAAAGATRMSRESHAREEPGAVSTGQVIALRQHRRSTNREPVARRYAPNRSTRRSGTGKENGA